jgi:hypothetical protein
MTSLGSVPPPPEHGHMSTELPGIAKLSEPVISRETHKIKVKWMDNVKVCT